MDEKTKQIIIEKMIYLKLKYPSLKNTKDVMLNINRKRGKEIESEINKSLKF